MHVRQRIPALAGFERRVHVPLEACLDVLEVLFAIALRDERAWSAGKRQGDRPGMPAAPRRQDKGGREQPPFRDGKRGAVHDKIAVVGKLVERGAIRLALKR
jgi:hypothetical protein